MFPVPPLCRNAEGALDFAESAKIVSYIAAGGIKNFLYGGNAFLYHHTLDEYGRLLEWLKNFPEDHWMIPSAGPSFGRAMDQARLLRFYKFPAVMMLPCGDPRDAAGLERGYRAISELARTPLIVYLKDEHNLGSDKLAGLDAVARLVSDGVCVGIKYAVVRENPSVDPYLMALLERVDRKWVISGIGERPAIAHMRDFRLPGFTTGSGCIAPSLSRQIWEFNSIGEWDKAEQLRTKFLALEDIRDAQGPARVLHAAMELAGIAATGPIAPFVTPLDESQRKALGPVASELAAADAAVTAVGV